MSALSVVLVAVERVERMDEACYLRFLDVLRLVEDPTCPNDTRRECTIVWLLIHSSVPSLFSCSLLFLSGSMNLQIAQIVLIICIIFSQHLPLVCSDFFSFLHSYRSEHSRTMTQYLCLKIMEDWILSRWNLIERVEKLSIRSGVLKLFDNQAIYDDLPAARTKSVTPLSLSHSHSDPDSPRSS
jgi:hypothetical protein